MIIALITFLSIVAIYGIYLVIDDIKKQMEVNKQ